MTSYVDHFENCLSFIENNHLLVDCNLIDFITMNLWEKCLSPKLRYQLEQFGSGSDDKSDFINDNIDDVCSEFIQQTKILNLKNSQLVMKVNEISSLLPHINFQWETEDINRPKDFMSVKKQHEINVLTQVIRNLSKANSNLVIDVGAGKGYLATSLSQRYNIPVLAIDSCESRHNSAIRRQALMKKKKCQSFPLVKHSVEYIDETTNYSQLVRTSFSNYTDEDTFILAGLHTCGLLAHSMIKSFLNSPGLSILCVISCCYHLTEELLTEKYQLTKNARMLAQQSVERLSSKNELMSPTLFYRAILQVLLKSMGIDNARIGRGAPTNDFPTYAKWSLGKIAIESDKIPSTEQLTQLYDEYIDRKWKFNLFQILRIHAGSVIEAAIILDRAIYLQNSGKCDKVVVVKLFDPIISPRCYAIIALK